MVVFVAPQGLGLVFEVGMADHARDYDSDTDRHDHPDDGSDADPPPHPGNYGVPKNRQDRQWS